jgi:hypothetical protein
MNPKFPKKMNLTEWHALIQEEAERWSARLADIDIQVRDTLFDVTPDLPTDLMMLSAFFYSSYLNHYMTSLVTDSRIGIPSELLAQYAEIASEVAEAAIEQTFGPQSTPLDPDMLDPEDRVNMPGGDA